MRKFINSPAGQTLIIASVAGVAVYALYRSGAAVAQSVNPTNPNNVFAQGADAVGATLTGDQDFNLGYWLYDLFNKP